MDHAEGVGSFLPAGDAGFGAISVHFSICGRYEALSFGVVMAIQGNEKPEGSGCSPAKQISRRYVAVSVGLLMLVQSVLLIRSSWVHSPTWDEVGHLAAGISHWELGRFELYSVNPPLVRVVAAAPVALVARPEIDWGFYRSSPQLRSEVFVGRRFVEMHGEESFRYFFYARLALLPVALLGGWLCFLWAQRLFGLGSGLVALVFWTFSPNVLAYGSIITPDLGSAVAMLGASYVFYCWLCRRTWSWALALAGATSLAMLTKSVWLILPAVYFLVWTLTLILQRWQTRDAAASEAAVKLPSTAGQLCAACLFSLLLTNGFYGFAGSLKPLGDFEFFSTVFSGNEPCLDCGDSSAQPAVVPPGNRFAQSWIGRLPVPLPANYLQGIDIQTRDFERGRYDAGWQSYLMGQWQQGGWWYFYLLSLLIKVPLPTWILLGIGSVMALLWRPRPAVLLGVACLWGPALLVLLLVSASTGLNRYMRYALPVLPVLLIWASQVGRWVDPLLVSLSRSSITAPWRQHRLAAVPCMLACWLACGTIWYSPHHLGFFNVIAGGPSRGHEFLCDSNVDWGQGLIELKAWLRKNPDAASNLHLAYFGCIDPKWVGIDYRLPPPLSGDAVRRWPLAGGSSRLQPGWYVISKNYLVGHSMPIPSGDGRLHFKYFERPFCEYFSSFEPVAVIGDSMLVYELKPEDVSLVQSTHGLQHLQPVAAASLPAATSSRVLPSIAP